MWVKWFLYLVIVIYSLLDAYQTKLLISLGATEVNPLLAWLIQEAGTVDIVFVFKIFWLALLMFVLWWLDDN